MPRAATATPTRPATAADDPWVPLEAFLAEVNVAASTYRDWRNRGVAPIGKKLPNGGIFIRRSVIDAWWASLPDVS